MKHLFSDIKEHWIGPPTSISSTWSTRLLIQDENLQYVSWNSESNEVLIVDPVLEDVAKLANEIQKLPHCRVIGIIDTHTHADHLTGTFELSEKLNAPILMHARAPSQRVHLRIHRDCSIPLGAAPLEFWTTPGHTADGLCVRWGPFVYTGDTVLFGDVGRDDLPTGNAIEHYESLIKLKSLIRSDDIFLPGHDHKGGRISSWAYQLQNNSSLTQGKESFIKEASEFQTTAPKLFKESLSYNFR